MVFDIMRNEFFTFFIGFGRKLLYNAADLVRGSMCSSVIRELSVNKLFGQIVAVGNFEYG